MHPKIAEKGRAEDLPTGHEGEIAVTGGVDRFLISTTVCSHPASMEQEKRIRREVANSNERRRMQSINAGFLALRSMLPQREGEKLSKAAILQQTSDFICNLEQEKTRLLTQNCQLKRLLGPQSVGGGDSPDPAAVDSPAPPPQSVVSRSGSQEELCDSAQLIPPQELKQEPQEPPPPPLQALRLELQELRSQLEQERLQRLSAEERLRQTEERRQEQERMEQERQQQLQQRLPFKKLRLEPAVSPQLLIAERLVMTPPAAEEPVRQPPPPPVATRRPLYMSSTTSRQNLDTIVEAIRHLEGDHLFGDCPEPRQPRLEPAPTRLEPIQTRLEPIQTRLEPIQTRLEPMQVHHVEQVQTRVEPMLAQMEPLPTRLDPISARLEPMSSPLDLQRPCLEQEPQEAPLELTTHARSSSADPYRPAVIVAQLPPPRH